MKRIPKWVRNIIIGVILNTLKNTSFVQKIISRLKDKKAWVARAGIAVFTLLAAVKYYRPDLPIDDGVEVLGMIFSWLALEIGLDKSEVENIESQASKEFDPSQPIDLGGFQLPSPESVGLVKEVTKKVTSDEEN